MKIHREFGVKTPVQDDKYRERIIRYINLKLASLGLPYFGGGSQEDIELAHGLIQNFREKNRLLSDHLCPVDQRIQNFLDAFLADTEMKQIPRLPAKTFILDRYGLARELSLPADGDNFESNIVKSYRIQQGVLHNPKHDRRTTKGSFHIAEGGFPVPLDKKAVPKITFGLMLEAALNPPKDLTMLPFTSSQDLKAYTLLSLLLRPIVCPDVPEYINEKSLEIRFFAPGNLASNLDFVESIFGNAGDPNLPENDSALDPESWTGHTGCIILAPHLIRLTKKDLGLPNKKFATERQIADGMCWENDAELYNDGSPFKLTARTDEGVIVTLIADNYYGYSKKEVKTQTGFSANLYGLSEEEHAGGALTYPSYNLGTKFIPDSRIVGKGQTINDVAKLLGDRIALHKEGYARDNNYPNVFYIPENTAIDMETQEATWTHKGKKQCLRVLPENVYIHPSGYKIRLEKHPTSPAWRLVGTVPEGTLCHKPCTVSGGGKSEISKSVWNAISFGPVFVSDFEKDMDAVEEIIKKDYGIRFKAEFDRGPDHKSRPILSNKRSLGSVIKLLTPSYENTDEFNEWLESIPNHIKALVFTVKRFHQDDWDEKWRSNFSVDTVNGAPGNQIKFRGRPLVGSYLRVGVREDGSGWTYKLRQDFMPADKVQWEDDISASITVPAEKLEGLDGEYLQPSVKIVANCESRFFQRPDDAIHRGFDVQAEEDLASESNFISNFEPMTQADAKEVLERIIPFHQYTKPMQDLIKTFVADNKYTYFISSSHPRIVDGAPTKNPRYLQTRPDLLDPLPLYISEIGTRLHRHIPADKAVYFPVNAVLPGRRNNPADHKLGIRPLAVYNPIHYQELPELFMDFTASLTGKSPSTTGAGVEGALTKGPFNALPATADLNNALLAFILSGYNGFSSSAGYIGPNYKVDHDISLLIPELWSRMSEDERDPRYMIEKGYLEKLDDFEHKGKKILASRLGYRITRKFTRDFFGRMFDAPHSVFNMDMLKPELQSMEDYIDGIKNVCEAQQRVGKAYLDDGSVESAIPPLKVVLHIMAEGTYEGKTVEDPELRKLFTRDYVLSSSWYKERLQLRQKKQVKLYQQHIEYLHNFMETPRHREEAQRMGIPTRLEMAKKHLEFLKSDEYLDLIHGTIGADPLFKG